jgi:glycosyltransferase involved in cell wall biosynthesis
MKILQVSPRYYPHIGGVEYVVKSISERLVKMGHDVTILAGEMNIDKPKEEVVNGVSVIKWPVWSPGEAYYYPLKRNKLKDVIINYVRKFDIVHVHSAHSIFSVDVGILICNYAKVVFSMYYHGRGHTFLRNALWSLWRLYVSKLVNKASTISALSSVEAKRIGRDFPEAMKKLMVLPPGLEEDVFNYKWHGENSNYALYSGRIERYKRIEDAYRLIKRLNPNFKFIIIGTGSYSEKLKRRLKGEEVEFFSSQPRERYLELLSMARYAINLSRDETYSLFIAEASAIGTPIIASDTIAEALKAKGAALGNNVYLLGRANIYRWNDIIKIILKNYMEITDW